MPMLEANRDVSKMPPEIKAQLRHYFDSTGGLKVLPDKFSSQVPWHTTVLTKHPISYRYKDGGSDVDHALLLQTFTWDTPQKQQIVAVAQGSPLSAPVIVVPAKRHSNRLRIWKGPDERDAAICPIVKVYQGGGRRSLGYSTTSKLSESLATKPMPPPKRQRSSSTSKDQVMESNAMSNAMDHQTDMINCHCGHQREEGKMIRCEECYTWQHMPCFYPPNYEPLVHYCKACADHYQDTWAIKRRKSYSTSLSLAGTTEVTTPHKTPSTPKVQQDSASSDEEPLMRKRLRLTSGKLEVGTAYLDTPGRKPIGGSPYATQSDQATTTELSQHIPAGPTDDLDRPVEIKREDENFPEHLFKVSDGASSLPSNPFTTLARTKTTDLAAKSLPIQSPTTTNVSSVPIPTTTTLIFTDGKGNERRKALGQCDTMDKLFSQAAAARVVHQADKGAMLSFRLRGTADDPLVVLRGDDEDFEIMLESIRRQGPCVVDVERFEGRSE